MKFFKNIFSGIKSHMAQVNKGLREIRDLGMGPKS